jgi:hypothetical protein
MLLNNYASDEYLSKLCKIPIFLQDVYDLVTQNKNIAVDNTFKIYLRQYESDIIAIGN